MEVSQQEEIERVPEEEEDQQINVEEPRVINKIEREPENFQEKRNS